MARPRKNSPKPNTQELSLVPVEEQPYPLPEGWKWVRLGDCNCYIGETVNPALTKDKTFELYSVPSSADDHPEIILGSEIGSSKQSVELDDVLLCKINPRINRVWRVTGHTENTLIASSEWIIFRNKNLSSKYMMYCMRSEYFRKYMLSNVSGVGGSLMRAQPKHVRSYPIPLPSRNEQERIVTRIESLFAKLDEAKEKAEAVLDSYETRKAAILHKAFTGELTAKWREERGVRKESWKVHKISEICKVVRGGSPRPAGSPEFYDGTIPFMKVADITSVSGPYVSHAEHSIKEAGLKKTRYIKANTLLLTNSGATLGVPAICTFDTTINDGIAAFLNLKEESINYLYYFFKSKTSELRGINKGAAQPNLNTDIIGSIEINLPSSTEQQEITRILDSLLEKEQQSKEAAETVLEQIGLMKKAILAKAFRGELG